MLCDDEPLEEYMHLFFSCDFSQNFWMTLGMEWNTELNITDMLMDGKERIKTLVFKESMIAGYWSLWKHRNNIIFDHK